MAFPVSDLLRRAVTGLARRSQIDAWEGRLEEDQTTL